MDGRDMCSTHKQEQQQHHGIQNASSATELWVKAHHDAGSEAMGLTRIRTRIRNTATFTPVFNRAAYHPPLKGSCGYSHQVINVCGLLRMSSLTLYFYDSV
jgi:hypothetical protein